MIECKRASAILVMAFLLAAVNGYVNPNRLEWSRSALKDGEILLARALASDPPVLWVDARSRDEYAQDHIPNALALNEDEWEVLLPAFFGAWEPSRRTVVYCGSQECHASAAVAGRLREEMGLEDVFVLKGGWESWQARGR